MGEMGGRMREMGAWEGWAYERDGCMERVGV